MYFGYPVAAVAENWLHECLCEMVTAIHTSLDAGDTAPRWPDIIPAVRRSRLRSRTGLRDRLDGYAAAAARLRRAQRARVLTCLTEQNEIANLVRGVTNCDALDDLPQPIRTPVTDLFTF